MKTRIILYTIFLLLTFSKSSFADDQKLENKINKNLRCLICQGQSIYDSDSEFANSLKSLVKQKLDDGYKEKEIYDFLNKRDIAIKLDNEKDLERHLLRDLSEYNKLVSNNLDDLNNYGSKLLLDTTNEVIKLKDEF